MVRFEGPPRDGGLFPASPNILYRNSGETIFKDSDYKIVVKNTSSGYTFKSQTPVVGDVNIIRPTLSQEIRWVNSSASPVQVEHSSTPGGKIYNLTIRFRYREINNLAGTDENKSIDWIFVNKVLTKSELENAVSIRMDIEGDNFYKFVARKITPDPNVQRFAGTLDFIITVGAETFSNYLNITTASTNLLTTSPEYSNVEGGKGLFTSRSVSVRANKSMDSRSLDSLRVGRFTGNLGFQF
jgi:hypothetical protein